MANDDDTMFRDGDTAVSASACRLEVGSSSVGYDRLRLGSPVLAEVVTSAPMPTPELCEKLRALLPVPRPATQAASSTPDAG